MPTRRKISRHITRSLKKQKLSERLRRELSLILAVTLFLLTLLALIGQLGTVGEVGLSMARAVVGQGVWAIPLVCIGVILAQYRKQQYEGSLYWGLGMAFLLCGSLGLLHTIMIRPDLMGVIDVSSGGGYIGAVSSRLPRLIMGDIGAMVLLLGMGLAGAVMVFRLSVSDLLGSLMKTSESKVKSAQKTTRAEAKKRLEDAPSEAESLTSRARPLRALRTRDVSPPPQEPRPEPKPLVLKQTDWEGPSTALLHTADKKTRQPKKQLDAMHEEIVLKLAEFGIGVDRTGYRTGPTVTQFRLTPHEGVKVNKIAGLKNDLALALQATSIRIEAPIPGTSEVGIEVPNPERAMVHMREILEDRAFPSDKSSLRVALGRDVNNDPIVADLGEMPHLLIAGATGSGKSVGLNTFLISLLYQNSPQQLKLLLIDPKRVELRPYGGIPHLLTPVIVEADKALLALKWAVEEMMRRYEELSQHGCRNIAEYNQRKKEAQERMPTIVIVVDELADLMMRQFRKETEAAIARLTQMARAVGMHLIIATQRPSVDVITGLIKANIPTRIAFAVTSSIDSRTILDQTGAEDLLGRGDMLYSPAGLGKPTRVQGIYLDSPEIHAVLSHIKEQGEPTYDDSITAGTTEDAVGFDDAGAPSGGSMNEQAIEVIRSTGKASASLLQRRLSIGYARAARVLDELEEQGIIGPANGAKPREIYL